MKNIFVNRKGVTLIELLFALALIAIVTQIIYSMYFVGNKSFAVGNNKGFSQQGVRLASGFIISELKYADNILSQTQIDDEIINIDYYSLSLEDIGDGYKGLVKTKYSKDGTVTQEKSLSGVWKFIRIYNTEYGILNLVIRQEEGNKNNKSEYQLHSEIVLENNNILLTSIDLELSGTNKIYYTLAKDNIVASIDIINLGTDETDETDETGETGGKVSIGELDKLTFTKNSGKFEVKTTINNGSGNFSILTDASYNIDTNNPRLITISGKAPNGNSSVNFYITVTDKDTDELDTRNFVLTAK